MITFEVRCWQGSPYIVGHLRNPSSPRNLDAMMIGCPICRFLQVIISLPVALVMATSSGSIFRSFRFPISLPHSFRTVVLNPHFIG
jgi:hypothetical protein